MDSTTMFSIVILISVAVCNTANSVQNNDLESSFLLKEPYEIAARQGKSLFSNLGSIPARNCGGAGRLLQLRNEACTTPLLGGGCAYPAGHQQRVEISFIPSGPTESLSVQTIVNDNQGEQIAWQNPNVSTDGPIHAGKEYSFKAGVEIGPKLQGKLLTVQLQFYRESDKTVEVCTETEFLIV